MNRAQRRAAGMKNDKMDMTVSSRDGKVIVEFNVMLRWFSLTLPEAESMVGQLLQQINNLKNIANAEANARAIETAKEKM